MTALIRISMALVALAAFALSFATLMALAELAGYGRLSWLYPVTLDLGTVASCAAWMTSKSRQAFHLTWCLLTGSILLNGVEHWLVATGQRPAWWLITVIAMAPPAILGVVTHLAVGLGSPDRNGSDMEVPAGALAPGVSRSAGGNTQSAEAQSDSEHRPDRLTDPDEEPAGQAASRAPERHPTPTRDLGGETPSPDIGRPDQLIRVGLAGPTAPDARQGQGAPTRPIAGQTPESDAGQPDHGNCEGTTVGLTTRGVWRSAFDDTRADNPRPQLISQGPGVGQPDQDRREEGLAGLTSFGGHPEGSSDASTKYDELEELISQGVGRRRLAAQLDISVHHARRLLAERRNGSAVRR